MTQVPHLRLGFMGGGQMATALAHGAIKGHVITSDLLDFCEPLESQRGKLKHAFPDCQVTESPSALFDACPRIVLAVKPQVLKEVVGKVRPLVRDEHLIVSIVAGISLDLLSEWLGTERIIRVMPNTPAQVLAGASGMAAGTGASSEDLAWTQALMQSVGTCVRVSDAQLHAVTALSGSGPAYVLMMIEALADGGVAAGLPRDVAHQLAVQTVLGTAKMVQETGQHPAILRDQVASPGGTTIAGMRALERHGLRTSCIEAVIAAWHRSTELGSK